MSIKKKSVVTKIQQNSYLKQKIPLMIICLFAILIAYWIIVFVIANMVDNQYRVEEERMITSRSLAHLLMWMATAARDLVGTLNEQMLFERGLIPSAKDRFQKYSDKPVMEYLDHHYFWRKRLIEIYLDY